MPQRCFLALVLPPTAIHSIQRGGAAFLERAPAWTGEKWVRPEQLHITLEFLGSIEDSSVDALVGRMKKAAAGIRGFDIALNGIKAQPSLRHAIMLWATVRDQSSAVGGLRDRLLAAADRPSGPARTYRPHVTMVRARRPRPVPERALEAASKIVYDAGKVPDGIVSVRSVTLFSSTLSATGPEYREIATLALSR